MLYIVGLGLGDYKDITVRGLEIVKSCNVVYLEAYTSILTCGVETLEQFYGRSILIADRNLIEEGADGIIEQSKDKDVALLVVGDPLGATTHTDIVLRAEEKGINVRIIHNASIISAVGCCGLHLYNFGETVSIPYWTDNWQPDSFFSKILKNYTNNMHTLCLLDIKVKEPTLESLTKKKREYLPPRFMSVKEAIEQLLIIIEKQKTGNEELEINENTLCIGLARVGSDNQKIIAGSLRQLSTIDLGGPLHSLVIPTANLHPMEMEYLKKFKC